MPVYNGASYLRETMQSILSQTYSDYEFLIIDDGSTDNSLEIIRSFSDPRIRVLKNPQRLKLSGALNRGMDEARGKYIARMDADDISLPHRLQRQVDYLDQHPETGVCGSGIKIFGKGRKRVDLYPATSEEIRAYALFDCPFCHPSVILRKDLFEYHNLRYDGLFYPTEDYELWSRAVDLFPSANLSEVLVHYRIHDSSMTCSDWDAMDEKAGWIIKRLLGKIGVHCSEEELWLHRNAGRGRSFRCKYIGELDQAEKWLGALLVKNRQQQHYEERALSKIISLVWYRLCFNAAPLGFQVLVRYRNSWLVSNDNMQKKRAAMLFLSIIKNRIIAPETD